MDRKFAFDVEDSDSDAPGGVRHRRRRPGVAAQSLAGEHNGIKVRLRPCSTLPSRSGVSYGVPVLHEFVARWLFQLATCSSPRILSILCGDGT